MLYSEEESKRYAKKNNSCNVNSACRGARRVSRPKRRKNEIAG